MTDRERLRIGDMKLQLCEEQNHSCACGCKAHVQADSCDLAHRIPATAGNLATLGKSVIHHKLNVGAVPAGRLDCNKRVQIDNAHWEDRRGKLAEIQEALRHETVSP